MNKISAQNTIVINASDSLSKAENAQSALSARKPSEIQSLTDWEMVLVGGGDTVVCW